MKPAALPVLADGIPTELRERSQWVNWRYAERDGRWTKLPIIAGTDRHASSTDARTWRSFADVVTAYRCGRFDGIGFVFAADDPYCGIDLDNCRDPVTAVTAAWAADVIAKLDSYAEISPSGRGVKIITRATLPGSGRRRQWHDGEVEMYDRARYFALTGRVVTSAEAPTV
jgi:primase-polymerase (primpol)-like protein